jgi:hypothetical protein
MAEVCKMLNLLLCEWFAVVRGICEVVCQFDEMFLCHGRNLLWIVTLESFEVSGNEDDQRDYALHHSATPQPLAMILSASVTLPSATLCASAVSLQIKGQFLKCPEVELQCWQKPPAF